MSSLSVLVSLNAPTARSAYQKLSLVMLGLWFIPMFALNIIPEEIKFSVNQFISNTNMIQVAAIGIIVVLILDGFLIWLSMQRFKRTRLILD
jgi:ABC-2 type transport system permease protein